MEFFGIGATELMVILVIAIVLFGPDKIPTMAGQVAKTIRDFRRYTSELTKEFNDATGGLKDEIQGTIADLRGELEATQADLRSQLDLTGIMQEAAAAANGTAVAAPAAAAAVAAGTPTPEAPEAAFEVAEPAADETITVLTPYAEAQAAAAAEAAAPVAVSVATNGHAIAVKADPFADLVNLIDIAPQPDAIAVVSPIAESPAVADMDTILPNAAHLPIHENGTKPPANGRVKIGGSVAGSKYARRKSA